MILYLKTTFDTQTRKFNAQKVSLRYKNDNEINEKDFPAFSDIEATGVLEFKVNPLEMKRWWDALPQDSRASDYILVWDGGWMSIPGNTIEAMNME